MVFVQILSMLAILILGYFSLLVINNIQFLCDKIESYYTKVDEMNLYKVGSLCTSLRRKYYTMMISWLVVILVRLFGNWLCWRAYGVLRKRFEEQELRRKNKLRYIRLKK